MALPEPLSRWRTLGLSARTIPGARPQVLGLLTAFGLLLGLFLWNESRASEPVLPLRIFLHPTVAAAAAVALVRAVAFYSLIVYLPLLVQGALGGTPGDARDALTAFAMPAILGAVAAGFLIGRGVGYRVLLVGGLALYAAGLWLVGQMGVAGQGELLRDLALAGFGVGLTQVTIVLALQNSVGREHMGTASSLAQFLTNLAGTMGVSLLGAYQSSLLVEATRPVLTSPAPGQLPARAAETLADPAGLGRVLTSAGVASEFPAELVVLLRAALENSLRGVFQVGLALTAVALLVSLLMRGSADGRARAGSSEEGVQCDAQ